MGDYGYWHYETILNNKNGEISLNEKEKHLSKYTSRSYRLDPNLNPGSQGTNTHTHRDTIFGKFVSH